MWVRPPPGALLVYHPNRPLNCANGAKRRSCCVRACPALSGVLRVSVPNTCPGLREEIQRSDRRPGCQANLLCFVSRDRCAHTRHVLEERPRLVFQAALLVLAGRRRRASHARRCSACPAPPMPVQAAACQRPAPRTAAKIRALQGSPRSACAPAVLVASAPITDVHTAPATSSTSIAAQVSCTSSRRTSPGGHSTPHEDSSLALSSPDPCHTVPPPSCQETRRP